MEETLAGGTLALWTALSGEEINREAILEPFLAVTTRPNKNTLRFHQNTVSTLNAVRIRGKCDSVEMIACNWKWSGNWNLERVGRIIAVRPSDSDTSCSYLTATSSR